MSEHDHDQGPLDPTEARLQADAQAGCEESRLAITRRAVMGITASLFSSAALPSWAEAATTTDPRLLVVVLRGGLDGINAVVPYGDPAYFSMRGGIAIPKDKTLPMNGFFHLHPALKNFAAMFAAKEASVVEATCVPLRNRSHFDAQDNLENGFPGLVSNPTGWLNRLLTVLPTGSPVKLRGAIEIGPAPLILQGPAPVLGWSPTWFERPRGEISDAVKSIYAAKDRPLYEVLKRGLDADRIAQSINGNDNLSTLRKSFRGAGQLLKRADGPRIAALSVDNFDTHSSQGVLDGMLFAALKEMDDGLGDFKKAIGAAWSNTVVVMVSEFGRTVHVNGGLGTDHGVGTVTFLAGGAVNGGKVFGDWPGISERNLYEKSDLKPTTDLRSVFKGILHDHIGVPAGLLNSKVFPGSLSAPALKHMIRTSPAASPTNDQETATVSVDPSTLRPISAIAKYRATYPD